MPDLTMEFEFDHSADRMFDILRKAEDHERFMPLCRESRVSAVEADGYLVDYVVESRKYGFKREFGVRFEVDPGRRRIVASPRLDGEERVSGTSRIAFEDRPEGGSRAVVRVDYEATGPMRLVPLSPIIRRMFRKIMESATKRAARTPARAA